MKRLLWTLGTALAGVMVVTLAIASIDGDDRSGPTEEAAADPDAEDEVSLTESNDADDAEAASGDPDDEPEATTDGDPDDEPEAASGDPDGDPDDEPEATTDGDPDDEPEAASGDPDDEPEAASGDPDDDAAVLGAQETPPDELAVTGRTTELLLIIAGVMVAAGLLARGAEVGLRRASARR